MSRRNKDKRFKNQSLKERQWVMGITPTDKVTSMLSGAANPLVVITLIGSAPTVQGIPISRSMGCVVERLNRNFRLVVTCRHAFENLRNGYRLVVGMKNPRPTVLNVIGQPIEDTEPESDVAFMVVSDPSDAPTEPLIIGEQNPPVDGIKILYNAANCCDPIAGMYDVFVGRQTAQERNQRAFCKLSNRYTETTPIDDQARHQELMSDGWIGCRMFQMQSRTGNSGSPVWDDDLRLYGLDIRGTQPGDGKHQNMGDVLICLPTSELYAARQRIDARLQQLIFLLTQEQACGASAAVGFCFVREMGHVPVSYHPDCRQNRLIRSIRR